LGAKYSARLGHYCELSIRVNTHFDKIGIKRRKKDKEGEKMR